MDTKDRIALNFVSAKVSFNFSINMTETRTNFFGNRPTLNINELQITIVSNINVLEMTVCKDIWTWSLNCLTDCWYTYLLTY